MRKKLALLLALALILCLFGACGQGGSTAETSAPVESVSVPVEQAAPEPEEPAPVEEASAEAPSSAEEVSEAKPVDIPPLAVTLPLDETATVTIWDVFPPPLVGYMEGPWDCVANQLLEDATNIHLDYTSVSTETASELFNLMVASHVYCDLIYGVNDFYSPGPDAAIADEIIIDLSDMAATMPNYQRLLSEFPDAVEHTTGGKMYRFPMIATEQFSDTVRGPATRSDWLKEQGINVPETLDEFHDMLLAFHNAYGGGTYLMDVSGFDNNIGGGFGVQYGFYQVDGVVKYGPPGEGLQRVCRVCPHALRGRAAGSGLLRPVRTSHRHDL